MIHDERCRNILHTCKVVSDKRYRDILYTNKAISNKRHRGIPHTSKAISDKRCRGIPHTYKLIPGCAHTNILISDKWVLSGMNVQKTDANRSVLSETISIEPYANGPVSKYPDSEYEYVDAIESALPRTT